MRGRTVSVCADARATACKQIDAVEAVERIRTGGRCREQIETIRRAYSAAQAAGEDPRKAVGAMKQALPGILWSGTFATRKADAILGHSGLLVADLDALESGTLERARTALVADPSAFAVFLSPTGSGLKAVFSVPADCSRHLAAFEAVRARVLEACGVEIDPSGKDLARLCFVSLDPAAHLNPDAVELAIPAADLKPERQVPLPLKGDALSLRERVAAEVLGEIEWTEAGKGFIACPGRELHTQPNGRRDCEVFMEGAPSIHCVHSSCRALVDSANRRLRSAIGRAESPVPRLGGGERSSELEDLPSPAARAWPAPIHPAALIGLAGEFVGTLEPHTEADPHAVLLLFLAAFGNAAGPAAHFVAQGSLHPGRVWPVLVGETAGGRKGSAWATVREVLRRVDDRWAGNCIASGLSSGEGLIWAVRDPITKEKRDKAGVVESFVEDAGVEDKRLLTVEEEFTAVLKVAGREGNTVSDLLRKAWDSGHLRSLTKNSPARATGAHVTVTAHVTRADLKKHLAETDALNGFGNRFLWLAVRRSKKLPFGGELHRMDLSPLVRRIELALDHARETKEVGFAEAARPLWVRAYDALAIERPGLLGAITQRAEAQVVRLALLYALLDGAAVIEVPHLKAALAVWDYCERSASYIFGDAIGDSTADRILDELRAAGSRGLTGTEIRDLFQRHATRQRLADALDLLVRQGRASQAKEATGEAGGRPTVRWRATGDRSDKTSEVSRLLESEGATEATKPSALGVMSHMSQVSPVNAVEEVAVEEGSI